MDDLWFFFVLPMLAAAVVAVVEWRRHREGAEHGERIVSLEHRLSNLESLASAYDPPDLTPIAEKLALLEYNINALGQRVSKMEEE